MTDLEITITSRFDNTQVLSSYQSISVKTEINSQELPDVLIPLLNAFASVQKAINDLNKAKRQRT
jgi:hypothetical protein